MNIALFGAGYVGLVTGACFAEMGNTVICVDVDDNRVEALRRDEIPIYEPGLDRLIERNSGDGRLSFTSEAAQPVAGADIVFICVGTPPDADGVADLSYVRDCARTIGRHVTGETVVVTKSTVPVGTTAEVREIIAGELAARKSDAVVEVANNPEFLKEGTAVSDFMKPDRIVVGTASDRARKVMDRLYAPFCRTEGRLIFMGVESSEMTKYASNAMLATRISFMNEVALLAEKVGADIEEIRGGMARDKRIGKYFLYAGAGYGGSCFPKDIAALIRTGRAQACDMRVVTAVDEANTYQKRVIVEKVRRFFRGKLTGRKIALWGLAFKPETDDIRMAPGIETTQLLRGYGATLAVHDPVALDNARKILGGESVTYHTNAFEPLDGADALIVMTEWKEYRTPDWRRIAELMAGRAVFDGRNLYDPAELADRGFRYFGIGHGETV